MDGKHTIFDQRRPNWDGDVDLPPSLCLIVRAFSPERESAFLADRGQITSDQLLDPAKAD